MSWKSRIGWFHGKRHLWIVMERRHGNQHLLSVTEKASRNASWKQRRAQRHGKASWKAILVERHGIVVTECVTENINDHRMQHFRNVMEKSPWMVSWKATPVQRHGKASWNASRKPRGVQRHGKALRKVILVERHGIVVTECVTESISDHRM